MLETPVFSIGNIPIYGDLILAPMDGYTDSSFRRLTRRLGSAYSVTEFINGLDVIHQNSFYPPRARFDADERPIGFQLLDDDPDRMLKSASFLFERYRPDFFDVNLGCADRQVSSRGAGAGLLLQPEKIKTIFQLLCTALPVPVTAKIRLGWDEHQLNYREVAKIVEDYGAALLAVHGRTRQQGYKGEADWLPIAEIKQMLKIPVIGNGDVCTPEDIEAIKRLTHCDGVMIGRAAVKNPWIFQRRLREDIPLAEVFTVIRAHLNEILSFDAARGLIRFRKFAKAYLSPYPLEKDWINRLVTTSSVDYFLDTLEQIQTLLEQANCQ